MRVRYIDAVMRQDMAYFDNARSGAVVAAFNDDSEDPLVALAAANAKFGLSCGRKSAAEPASRAAEGRAAPQAAKAAGGVDDEEDERRKRRALEAQREKDERKATKKKCEWCHRAACIC